MKQTQTQMIVQIIEKHQESEAKLMKSINEVDADIELAKELFHFYPFKYTGRNLKRQNVYDHDLI